ncbi:hypothetical protein RIEPE_0211 [Candidatus Riesia pediculicola USDA]|uniref:Uncharacterized protein n=1 Tax=Riesia pediculicola (strain USDA) TaxID=515618 RepID=D4G819_RIEPU|nr:hypothetical protein RIEPE_0211 [Candidatus Riesia pediculicola USDA]
MKRIKNHLPPNLNFSKIYLNFQTEIKRTNKLFYSMKIMNLFDLIVRLILEKF